MPDFWITQVPLKRRALEAFHVLLYKSCISRAYACINDLNGAIVLMYHSVSEEAHSSFIDPNNRVAPEIFSRHMRFLAEKRQVVSIDALSNSLNAGEPLPQGSVVITLDDGYLDNLTVAAPILRELNLPATLYLATGYISRAENQWIDQAFFMFKYRKHHLLRIVGSSDEWNLEDQACARAACRELCSRLLISDHDSRIVLLRDAMEQLKPKGTPPG